MTPYPIPPPPHTTFKRYLRKLIFGMQPYYDPTNKM
jgi:hypothetical protein